MNGWSGEQKELMAKWAAGNQKIPKAKFHIWPAPPHASQRLGPELARVLDLAEAAGPSRLPLR